MSRFSPSSLDEATVSMLGHAGWQPGRQVDVEELAREFDAWGLPMHQYARSVLESLYGLTVEPVGPEGANFHVDKIRFDPDLAADREVVDEVSRQFAADMFPIACMYTDGIYVSPEGLTVCSLQDENWLVGRTFEEALDRLVCLTGEVEVFDRP
ncbi:SUKH-3 domain-containing protein [Kitasatospora sp. NPDC049258]|uniref:SUKH-3 domain-containing protein n=1 Tax=Kitasatospora sp. NPDC049258 TaxID=3155394 RepID=UPI0034448CA1